MDAEELVVEEAQVAELLQEDATATEPEPSSEWFQVVALVGSHHLPAVQAPSPLQLQMGPGFAAGTFCAFLLTRHP